ncbi:M48 family metalloprotease [Prosthecomicrobium pneumaticum]|uniref:Putative Zn-dependent protease n=1 Tax=Prosthecomicrobium pneumaticum TaxID=81895 RepID=A0A7W9L3Y2_9HYPH|nr:M48 family metalloprotease [Prosthecomicrobium pneumaticum]MBB5755033.1 putative Zn-dependent protease [Prosthecomicrobium pneumaticum]
MLRSACRRIGRAALTALVAGALAASAGTAALAQQAGRSIVRDAETEALLQDYLRPIFKAAGIRSGSVEVLLIPDPSFNAFVANGRQMFVNTGAIIDSKVPNELIGVLAHETGHLAGGHLARLREQLERAKTLALIGGLAGMAVSVGGAIGGSADTARAGMGLGAGVGEIARRNLLAYARSEEYAADQSALQYLAATGQSAAGMLTTFRRFAEDTMFLSRRVDPYAQSHPMPTERIDQIEAAAKASPSWGARDSAQLIARHDLVRAKLVGFTEQPQLAMRRYPMTDRSLPARYARAVVAYRLGNAADALRQVDGLIKASPNFPYFHELKGQILLETGRPREAVPPLRKAVSLASSSGLLKVLLGHALVETGDPKNVDEAVKNLTVGLQADPNFSIGYRQLARAYAMRGDTALAELATAQGDFVEGEIKDAKMHAQRAQNGLKRGSPGWLRADDILTYQPPPKTR